MMQEGSTRPWGKYEVLSSSPGYKIKKITVKPKCRISYQSHAQRNEIWIVVQGSGLVTLDEKSSKVKYNSIICIPQGSKHRIENRSSDYDLIFIEVQTGNSFHESDIERYQDDFGRT